MPSKGSESFWFRVTGSVLKFDGFLKVYEESKEGKDEEDEELKHKLPALEAGPEAHAERTETGAAFHRAAAALQRSVAGEGAGRARHRPAVDVFGDSGDHSGAAVCDEDRREVFATEIGLVVTDLLVENFHDIFDGLHRPARRRTRRDRRWQREVDRRARDFYKKFEKDLNYAGKHMENIKRMEKPTDEKCERCGSPLVIKWGKHGASSLAAPTTRKIRTVHVYQRKSHQPA